MLFALPWFDMVGLVSGLLCVWLLIRQNVWTFPIGLIYAFVSLVIFMRARLYADFAEHIYYVAMNAYGWYYWLRGAGPAGASKTVPVTRMGWRAGLALALVGGLTTVVVGWLLDNRTDADLAYWDTSTTVASFIAMWMTARKYLENWYVWFAVDVVKTVIYVVKGIDLYAALYAIYLVMAVMGWWSWRQSLTQPSTA